MIPLCLQLKNFLSYGPILQTVNFEPYNLICLSGKNGHGKSALLDAITWALWGQARKISGASKADPHLVHLGQYNMLVIFDFLFNGASYRVRREFTQAYGKSNSALDFGIINPDTGSFNSLTTNASRTTQEIITETLGLTYEAFINTAFLRQGASNEFSKKSSKERKDILASILGLQHYDVLRTKALDAIKKFQEERSIATLFVQKLEQELREAQNSLTQTPFLMSQWDSLQHQEALLIHLLEQVAHQDEILAQEQMVINHNQALQKQQEAQFIQLKQEFITSWQQARTLRNSYDQQLANTLEKEYHSSCQKAKNFQNDCQLLIQLKNSLDALLKNQQERIHEHAQSSLKEIQTQEEAIKQHLINYQLNEQVLENFLKELRHEEHEYMLLDEESKKSEEEIRFVETSIKPYNALFFEKQKNSYQQWLARAHHLQKAYEQLIQKITLYQDNQSACLVCKQSISADQKRLLQLSHTKQQQHIEHQINRLKRILPLIQQQLRLQHTHNELFQKQSQELVQKKVVFEQTIKSLQLKADKVKELNQKIEEQRTRVTQNKENLLSLQQKLIFLQKTHEDLIKSDPYLQELNQKISSIQTQIIVLNHNEIEHQNYIEYHSVVIKKYQEMLIQLQYKQSYKDRCLHLAKQLAVLQKIKKTLHPITIMQQQLHYINQQRNILATHKQRYLQELASCQKSKEILLQEQGKISLLKQRVNHLVETIQQEQHKIERAHKEIEDYTLIATALGKDGIQALLIEEAIPEIEQEANALLAQLTDNQTHLFIDSLRDLKKGGTKETLDIKISDAAGIRPYELFSGGEAFRIDFALRVAISKLLARRAGTSLQTLIIDEGFGSQDEDGLSHIMDAIHRIQNNFCKIIIVSHLVTMKEQFPVHFIVHKSAQGSSITTIQQG